MPRISQIPPPQGAIVGTDTIVISNGTLAARSIHATRLDTLRVVIDGGGSNPMAAPALYGPNSEWTNPNQAIVHWKFPPSLSNYVNQGVPFRGRNVKQVTLLPGTPVGRYWRIHFTNKFTAINDPGGTVTLPYMLSSQVIPQPGVGGNGTIPFAVMVKDSDPNNKKNLWCDIEIVPRMVAQRAQWTATPVDSMYVWLNGPIPTL